MTIGVELGLLLVFALGVVGSMLQSSWRQREDRPRTSPCVDTIMARIPRTLDATDTVDDALERGFGQQLFTTFPVIDGRGSAVGLVSLDDVRAVRSDARGSTTVAEVMSTDPAVFVAADATVDAVLLTAGFARRGRAVVVGPDGGPVGLLSITDVRRALRV